MKSYTKFRGGYDAQPIKRERTEEEKLRRHLHGDKGAKFSARQMVPGKDGVMGAITTVIEKDNLVMEAMIQDNEVILKKERTSKTRPKGKGWEEVITEDGRRAWVRLRKLTPRECFRLQGVREPDIDKMLNAGISDSQLYKLAGNSICVDCMVALFRNLYFPEEGESLTLF
jgi:DNA (cytosine-5)-methyltransferase 1